MTDRRKPEKPKNLVKLSKAKKLMLDMLASGEPVKAKDLLNATGQAEYARRLRELRDQDGYDLVSYSLGNDVVWQLKSNKMTPSKNRTYLGNKQKAKLLSEASSCANCGGHFSETLKPVFDHRVPLIRGGNGTLDNFQVLCVRCNNTKRTECKGCSRDCTNCFFAFPEKVKAPIIVYDLTEKQGEALKKKASSVNSSVAEYVADVLKRELKKTKIG